MYNRIIENMFWKYIYFYFNFLDLYMNYDRNY